MIYTQDVNGRKCHIAYLSPCNTQQLLALNEEAAQALRIVLCVLCSCILQLI